MRRPLIGLTAYAQQVQYGSNEVMAGMLPMTYVRAVHATGGRAVLITPDDPGTDVLESLDGIVFAGGGDVDPSHWGAEVHSATDSDPVRDASELQLMRALVGLLSPQEDAAERATLLERLLENESGIEAGRIALELGDLWQALAECRAPLAVVRGALSGMTGGDVNARLRRAAPPGTPFIDIPEAHHHVQIDQPLALVAALRTLLEAWA